MLWNLQSSFNAPGRISTQLDAAAINIMRPRPKKKTTSKKGPGRVEVSRLAGEM
jgi:hypothetical protein